DDAGSGRSGTGRPGGPSRALPLVSIYNSRIAGGIFAPNGLVSVFADLDLTGSLVGGALTLAEGLTADDWEANYLAHEQRMNSFAIDPRGVVRPGSGGELALVGWTEVQP